VSDSAEQTIARRQSKSDLPAIASFLSGTTGKFKTLFDQSATNDASQTTAGSQPDYTTHLNRPVISFNAAGSLLTLPSAPTLTGRNFTIYSVFSVNDYTFSGMANWPDGQVGTFSDFGSFAAGVYAPLETRSASAKINLAWTANPQSGVIMAGNCSVNVRVIRSNGTNTHFRVNEISADSATLATAVGVAATKIGRGTSGGYSPAARLMALLVGPAHTAAQEKAIVASLQALFNTAPKTRSVFFDGDSITAGQSETDNLDHRDLSWPYVMMLALGNQSVMACNRAFASAQIVDGTGDPNKDLTVWAPTKLDAYLNSAYSSKVLVVMAGSNDISVINAAGAGLTTYNRLVTYCQARRTAGWSKIVVVNCIPRKDFVATVKETERLDYNTRIATNALTDWDALIDAAALNWQPGGASDWSTNYQGTVGIHPNAAGRVLLANATQSTVQGYL
jgi:lysophospholipase L1-like esterase